MPYKILFVSHNASRTGAPIVFLHLLKWLKKNSDIEITLLLMSGGELKKEFDSIALSNIWFDFYEKNLYQSFLDRIYRRLKKMDYRQYILLKKLKKTNFDLVYTNTVDSHYLIPILKPYLSKPFVSHVHENEYTCNSLFADRMKKEILKEITHFIAVSKSTQENLAINHGISHSIISTFYPFIPINEISAPKKTASEIKEELGLNKEFIVGGCGFSGWRKGVDHFINLAFILKGMAPEMKIKFVWVGYADEHTLGAFEYEKHRLGIEDKIVFTGVKTNAQDYFQIFDIFALTSREDPFPLVCLEAASQSKPIVCFENAGGMSEFVKKGGGWSVPYGNIEQMAKKILYLANDTFLAIERGKKAKELVEEYDVNVIAPHIYECIKEIVTTNSVKNSYTK